MLQAKTSAPVWPYGTWNRNGLFPDFPLFTSRCNFRVVDIGISIEASVIISWRKSKRNSDFGIENRTIDFQTFKQEQSWINDWFLVY